MSWSNLLSAAGWAVGVAGGLTGTYLVARRVYDDWALRAFQRRTFDRQDEAAKAKINAFSQLSAVKALRHLSADEHGRLGAVVRPDGTALILDTHAMFDRDWNVARVDEVRERLDHMERLLLAMPKGAGSTEQLAALEGEQVPQIPEFVDSRQILEGAPSYRRLVLGKTEHQTVYADMADMVHIAVGGSSGWGKSIFLRWMVYQLVKSTDPLQLVLIDLEGATLGSFGRSSRVLYPVADTEQDAIAVMTELTTELDRRKALFNQHEGVLKWHEYNEVADEPLTPIVVVIDEATALLENKLVEGHLRTLALRARKYGVWLLLAGQDWKATSLDSAIRNMLGARIQFKAMSKAQSRVLINEAGAEELHVRGRAIAVLPGRDPITFQAPLIKESEIREAVKGGPLHEMPTIADKEEDFDAQVKELWDRGVQSISDMCEALGLKPAGASFYKVKSARKRLGYE